MRLQNKGLFPAVIDSSIRSSFVSCPTKFFWSYQRQLGPSEPSTDLIAGGAFARGLEVVRKAVYGPEKKPLDVALREGMIAAIEQYGEHVPPLHKAAKGIDRVVQALDFYFTTYPPHADPIQPYMSGGLPSVEFTFSLPLPINHPESGEPLLYGGRFDMMGVYQGQLIVVDEKTTTQLGPTWPNKWNLRGQFTGYIYAAHQYGLPAMGAIARGISFLKNNFGNAESIQMRPTWMLDQWYEQLLMDVDRMVLSWNTGWYDQNFDETCAEYSGCPFQTLCQSNTPEDWIIGRYAKRVWNPLDKNPAKQEEAPKLESIPADELSHLLGGP